MKVLKLGIPKGSLEANTIDLFKKPAGTSPVMPEAISLI